MSTVITKDNPKYVDLLDEDQSISGQKFVCLSFISPEKILKERESYLFSEFTKQWNMTKSKIVFSTFLQFISVKYNLDVNTLTECYKEFLIDEVSKHLTDEEIDNDYKTFKDFNEEKLTLLFDKKHNFKTNVRGIKVRGVFNTEEEASKHSKQLRKNDTHHDIYVAPVGLWLPWDPTALPDSKVDYLEPELNRLHEEKIKNEVDAKNEFDNRIRDAKRALIVANIAKAKESGNVLTQTIDENDNLIGVNNSIDFELRENVDIDNRTLREKNIIDSSR